MEKKIVDKKKKTFDSVLKEDIGEIGKYQILRLIFVGMLSQVRRSLYNIIIINIIISLFIVCRGRG